jgi:NAD(P)-dependent dehydrogenase (short-subunit alcohol dehydrogenase family)
MVVDNDRNLTPVDLTLSDKTVLVTGASSGLGAHFARLAADAGAKVILASRRENALSRQVEAIIARGGAAEAVALDVSDAASVERLWSTLGAVDVVINNAGVAIGKAALDHDADDWDRVFDTNLRGAFLVAAGAARRMRETGTAGSIVNVASILGLRQANGVVAYASSKAGLVQMTKSLALEVARYGIRVNALCPGYIETDLNRDFFQTDEGHALIRRIPQRRLGRLEDLDAPLLLLASDASDYITGITLAVDGGHLVSTL